MLVGWFCIYVCCHASAHWAVGRLVGIRFQGYSLRGTDHPEEYPTPIRQLMSVLPFFTALTRKESMQRAHPLGQGADVRGRGDLHRPVVVDRGGLVRLEMQTSHAALAAALVVLGWGPLHHPTLPERRYVA